MWLKLKLNSFSYYAAGCDAYVNRLNRIILVTAQKQGVQSAFMFVLSDVPYQEPVSVSWINVRFYYLIQFNPGFII